MKKETIAAPLLLLLIPVVCAFGGALFSFINPEWAAGHANYSRDYHLLTLLRLFCWLASGAIAALLWLLVCLLIIRSKQRSYSWLLLAILGPFGIAILASLTDRAPMESDRHAQLLRSLTRPIHLAYTLCVFCIILFLAWEGMVFNRMLIIRGQAIATGVSTSQILQQQNASGGMWAFAELNEVFYLIALLYLLWPILFNLAARWTGPKRPRRQVDPSPTITSST